MTRSTDEQAVNTYLTDASNFAGGSADGVFLPETEKDVIDFVRECAAKKTPISIAGAGTGLVGGRVPLGGWVLSTEKMNRIVEITQGPLGRESFAVVQPGVLLQTLLEEVDKQGLFYPADPTSILSFIGGNVAANASGPRSFKYGATRAFVRRLRVVLPSGDVIEIKRGANIVNKGEVNLPIENKEEPLHLKVPEIPKMKIKDAAGYLSHEGMDAIDLFIGSEGTLGIITEIEVGLLPKPATVFSRIAFFHSEKESWNFAEEAALRSRRSIESKNDASVAARAIEYFDEGSLNFIRDLYPSIPAEAKAAIYYEQECQPETEEFLIDQWSILEENHNAIEGAGWHAETPEQDRDFRAFRHSVPLKVREWLVEKGYRKIGTDYAVPLERFAELQEYQKKRLAEEGLVGITFGHIGDAHVHLNILPESEESFQKALEIYEEFVRKAFELGGTVSAEHGIGKIKKAFFREMVGDVVIDQMKAFKAALDPDNLLGCGNLLD